VHIGVVHLQGERWLGWVVVLVGLLLLPIGLAHGSSYWGGQKGNISMVVAKAWCVGGWGYCIETGEQSLEKQSIIIIGDGCKLSPYVKVQEGSASSQGGHHGEDGAGDYSTRFLHRFKYKKVYYQLVPQYQEHI